MKHIAFSFILTVLLFCSCGSNTTKSEITAEMAYAFVNFYVDKASGTTRMEEYVPTLDVRNDAGTIELFDYLKKNQ